MDDHFEIYKNLFIKQIKELGFKEISENEISYGVQIVGYYGTERSIFRLYYSKKGFKTDFSQIKSQKILELFEKKESPQLFEIEKTVSKAGKAKVDDVEGVKEEFFSIGSDETGKGDMIGPLFTAAVYVDETLAKTFRVLGVRDSKEITSQTELKELYTQITQTAPYSVQIIEPARYNKMYEKVKNINLILAWGHKEAIHEVLKTVDAEKKEVKRIIIDKFSTIDYFKKEFDKEVMQISKGEYYISVAAASIVARYTQLEYLKKLNMKYKKNSIEFSVGMSPKNSKMLSRYLDFYSVESLFYLTKLHFKTVDEIVSKKTLLK
ncbi:ribonuclease HIII [bacterium]|nr:ribonuclease HIII [bacterium]